MSQKLEEFMNEHHKFLLRKSSGLIMAKNVTPINVGGNRGCLARLDSTGKTKCCGKCRLITVFVEGAENCELAREHYSNGEIEEAEKYVKWKCTDEDKNNLILMSMKDEGFLQSAINLLSYDYLKEENKNTYIDGVERVVISKRQTEISRKRKKHRFYDEAIRKATITWQHFPTVSYARMAKALDSFFGDGVSRDAIEGGLKDARLRPDVPVKKTSFTLMG